ncbi:hypothetical protein G5I_02491 [Acromyrmex echinatior]|uniref:Uncharacterized protein n=1 Tax=Acromyrmex echinatior TaxID=103372 RepID=F4WAF5_ACREC|nr:hypothetical protein G5I_02491 [Acromyrmex echinatior]
MDEDLASTGRSLAEAMNMESPMSSIASDLSRSSLDSGSAKKRYFPRSKDSLMTGDAWESSVKRKYPTIPYYASYGRIKRTLQAFIAGHDLLHSSVDDVIAIANAVMQWHESVAPPHGAFRSRPLP